MLLQGSADVQYADALFEFWASLFEKKTFLKGSAIWSNDDAADYLLILECGELVIKMTDDEKEPIVIETILPGTMVGELEFFSHKPRLFTLLCENDSVVWSLSIDNFDEAFQKNPNAMRHFMVLALSFDITRFYNISHHWSQLR
jgi:SulP family sulfate permease